MRARHSYTILIVSVFAAAFCLFQQTPAFADEPRVIQFDECNAETVGQEFCMYPFLEGAKCDCQQNSGDSFICVENLDYLYDSYEEDSEGDVPEDEASGGRHFCINTACIPVEERYGVSESSGILVHHCDIGEQVCMEFENSSCIDMLFQCIQNSSGQFYLNFMSSCESCCSGECCTGPCCGETCCHHNETCCAGECCKHDCIDGQCVLADGDEEIDIATDENDSGCSASTGVSVIFFSLLFFLTIVRRKIW